MPATAGTLITVRLASTRLARKALLELDGEMVLHRLIRRVGSASLPGTVVVCTTEDPADDELEDAARSAGAEVYRGSREDILDRWLGAARTFDLDLIVACDGDDLLVDPVHIDRVVERHRETGADYITVEGLPFGTAPTGISVPGLARVVEAKSETETEGQGRFFQDGRLVRRDVVRAPEDLLLEEARMTLDYPDDLAFFARVLEDVDDPHALADVVAYLRVHPEVMEINNHLQAEYWERFRRNYPPVELA